MGNKSIFSKQSHTLELALLFLVSAGYVIVSAIAIPMHIGNSRILAVPFRILVAAISLGVIFRRFQWKKVKQLAIWSFILFWIYYSIKAWRSFSTDDYDTEFVEIEIQVFIRIITIVFLPGLALMLIDYNKLNLQKLTHWIFGAFFVILALNFVYMLGQYAVAGSFNDLFSLYYISAGHQATSLALMSLFFLLSLPRDKKKSVYFIGLLLGIVSMVMMRARGPFLALVVVSFYLVLLNRNRKLMIVYAILLLLAIVSIYEYGSKYPDSTAFASRTYQWLFHGDTSLREPLYHRSWQIFNSSPVFGGRVLFEDGVYSHNLFLELLMATGMVGFLLYFLKFYPVLKVSKIFVSKDSQYVGYIFFFILFLQYFVFVMTSSNLYRAGYFIQYTAIVIGIALSLKKNKEKQAAHNTVEK